MDTNVSVLPVMTWLHFSFLAVPVLISVVWMEVQDLKERRPQRHVRHFEEPVETKEPPQEAA